MDIIIESSAKMKNTLISLLHGRTIQLRLEGGRLHMRQQPVASLLSAVAGLAILGLYIGSMPFDYIGYALDWFSILLLLFVVGTILMQIGRLFTHPVWVLDRVKDEVRVSGKRKLWLSEVTSVAVREMKSRHRYNILLVGENGSVVLWYLVTEMEAMIVAEAIAAFLDIGILMQ